MLTSKRQSRVDFAVERLRDMLPEAEELWRLHWQETEGYRDAQGYKPNLEQFLMLDDVGWFVVFTAREAGRLAGHLAFIVHVGRHTSKREAIEDYFYIRKEFRGGGNGRALLEFAVKELKARGCAGIGMSSKVTNDISPLLKKTGFKEVASLWMMNCEENL